MGARPTSLTLATSTNRMRARPTSLPMATSTIDRMGARSTNLTLATATKLMMARRTNLTPAILTKPTPRDDVEPDETDQPDVNFE
jgi:hypothetical protein